MSQGSQTKSRQQQSTRKGQRPGEGSGAGGHSAPRNGGQGRVGVGPCGPHPRAAGSRQHASGAGGHTALVCTWQVGLGREARRTGRAARRSCSSRRRGKRATGEPLTPSSHCPHHRTESEGSGWGRSIQGSQATLSLSSAGFGDRPPRPLTEQTGKLRSHREAGSGQAGPRGHASDPRSLHVHACVCLCVRAREGVQGWDGGGSGAEG